MSATPLAAVASAAPLLSAEKSALAAHLVEGLDRQQLTWLSGYMAGAAACSLPGVEAADAVPTSGDEPILTVVFGSQTGNAKGVAEAVAGQAEQDGLAVRLLRADDYALHELKTERLLYVVISTHSSGDEVEPPDDSRGFVEHLNGRRAPKLDGLKFAVLGLGDSSYPDFCGVARQLDARLAELGGERVLECADADVDFENVAEDWQSKALARAGELQQKARQGPSSSLPSAVVTPLHPPVCWKRQHPFQAEVLANQRIVASASDKDVRHLELSLEGSGLTYQPGDALGVWPVQDAALVDAVLETLGLDGRSDVRCKNEVLSLRQWLRERRELTVLTRGFVAAQADRGGHAELEALLRDRKALASLLAGTQLLDLLWRWPADWDADDLVATLRPLAPRKYSIASSQAQVGEEVHLVVDRLQFEVDGEARWGVASRFLCELEEGATLPVFVEANDRFRLPADPARDVIMIGPGTGVAPFRAFVQERASLGGDGRNWMVFGNPHRRTDFLYQLEWQQALKRGHLDRLDVAFSRDQAEKVYVQHRIAEQGVELWRWLEGGAHLYLCGDADRMAPDVEQALREVAMAHGAKSSDEAVDWLSGLRREGSFARDVY